jgi:site-specific DNA-methyltransferase (adenine-specific)
MTNTLNLFKMHSAALEAGFHFHNILPWDKISATPSRWYMQNIEWALFFAKRPVKTINNPGSKQLFRYANPRNKRHPTEKPVELMEHYILNSTQPLDIVFDPFMGCGTTAIAAERTGRRWIGCEIDPLYFYPALARIAAL